MISASFFQPTVFGTVVLNRNYNKGSAAADKVTPITTWFASNIGFILLLAAATGIIWFIVTAKREARKEESLRKEMQEKYARDARLAQLEGDLHKEQSPEEIRQEIHRAFIASERAKLNDSLRYDILRRDGFRCQICGATQKDGYRLHVDHIIPVSKGGRTTPDNLRTLCERCNMGKSDKIERVNPA